MAYNFKSIADVEVVAEPTESANVLIEENGVIKKAPKTAVGGAGGQADLVFRWDGSTDWNSGTSIIEGNIEAVINKIQNGEYPEIIMLYDNDAVGSNYWWLGRTMCACSYYSGAFQLSAIYVSNCYGSFGYVRFVVTEDGVIHYDYNTDLQIH